MINLFDTANYPDSEPEELTAGDVWAWTRSDITATYPTDIYTLKYVFNRLNSSFTKKEITAGKVSSAHVLTAVNTVTSGFEADTYEYSVVIVRDSDSAEITLETGRVKITSSAGDRRSHARKVLDAINATIEKTATKEQQSYSIAGRSLSRRSVSELLELRREYEKLVRAEDQALLRKQGKGKKKTVLYKMSGR